MSGFKHPSQELSKEELIAVAKSALHDCFCSIRGEEWEYAILEVTKARGALGEILRQLKELREK